MSKRFVSLIAFLLTTWLLNVVMFGYGPQIQQASWGAADAKTRVVPESRIPEAPVVFACFDPTANDRDRVWANVALKSLILHQYAYNSRAQFRVETLPLSKCTALPSGAACYAHRRQVYCRIDMLGRALRAVAYLSVDSAMRLLTHLSLVLDPKALSEKLAFDSSVNDAFLIVTATSPELRSEAMIRSLRRNAGEEADDQTLLRMAALMLIASAQVAHLYISTPTTVEEMKQEGISICTGPDGKRKFCDPSNEVAGLAFMLFDDASSYIVTFILGHELSHAYGRCFLKDPSLSERAGHVGRIVSVQVQPKSPWHYRLRLDELSADRCALRAVEQVDRVMNTREGILEQTIRERLKLLRPWSKRFAIDAVGWLLHFGLTTSPTKGAQQDAENGAFYAAEGHLLPGLRLLLFSQLLYALTGWADNALVNVCGVTARELILGFEQLALPGKGPRSAQDRRRLQQYLVTAVGDYLPDGLRRRLEVNLLNSPDDFECRRGSSGLDAVGPTSIVPDTQDQSLRIGDQPKSPKPDDPASPLRGLQRLQRPQPQRIER
jgi:hypothetical protein